MKRCGVMVKKRGMPEARPCFRKRGHDGGPCTPNLAGLKNVFGYTEILKRAPDYVCSLTDTGKRTCWWVLDKFGRKKIVRASALFSGHSSGKISTGYPASKSMHRKGKPLPEYSTVMRHHNCIYNRFSKDHHIYKNMPFFDEWNPDKGGSFRFGVEWIIKNLPKRSKNDHLHVINRKIGFVPGNLMWVPQNKHQQEELLNKALLENSRLKKELEKLKNANSVE